ncbi:MAG: ComEC/Rec2 family competence protein [Pseudomonadota bacterium]
MSSLLLTDLFAKRQIIFAYWPCFLGLGIATYFTLSFEPILYFPVGILAVLFFGFMLFRRKLHEHAIAYFLSHALLAFTLGFCLSNARTSYLNTPFIATPINDHVITATVLTVELTHDGRKRFIVGDIDGAPIHKAQLKGKADLALEPGWRVRCVATLLPLSGAVSPAAYDFKRAHYFAGIGASGRIKSCVVIDKPTSTMANLRFSTTESLRARMNAPYGDIAAALVTGDRSGIPKDLRQQFTDAGLAHVLAISGLHLGLVAGIIFFAIKRLLLFGYLVRPVIPIREIAACLTILAMAFYLGLSGFGYPAIRSFGMTTLIMVGIIFNRDPLSMRSVALAASVILMLYPESLLSASFQLSFSAVIALIATYEITAQPLKNWAHADVKGKHASWHRGLIVYFCAIMLTTVVATLATTPLSMAIFNRLTLQAVLGNLLAIPLTGFWIMPALVVATISLVFGGWNVAFWAVEMGIHALSFIAIWVSKLPGSGLMVPTPSDLFYPFFVIGGILLCLGPWRYVRILGFGLACFSFVFFKNAALPIGYFAGDRSVLAVFHDDILYVSSLKRGQFYTDQWRQHLGVHPDHVKLMPTQDLVWRGFYVVADPFKNMIDPALSEWDVKKQYLTHLQLKTYGASVLTNSFWRNDAKVNAELLQEKGSAFLYEEGIVRFQSDLAHKRPWG